MTGPLARGRGASPLPNAGFDEDASPPTAPADDPQPAPKAAKRPAFEKFAKNKTITLAPASEAHGEKDLTFPACIPAGGGFRPNGKTVTLDAASSTSLKAVAAGPDAYVAIAKDPRTGRTSFILVPKSRVREVKD